MSQSKTMENHTKLILASTTFEQIHADALTSDVQCESSAIFSDTKG